MPETLTLKQQADAAQWQDVTSSNIKRVAFTEEGEDHTGATLFIEFKSGGLYAYHGCSRSMFDSLVSASSVGKFFDANIKKNASIDWDKVS